MGSLINYSKEKLFQKLIASREERNVIIIRESKPLLISVHSLLVGDILQVNCGDLLPADCILLSGNKIIVDESSQTGETYDIDKKPLLLNAQASANPFLLSGTIIKDGKGIAVVVCVGSNTRMGKIREMLNPEDEMTPLQRKLIRIADGIGKFCIIFACVTGIGMGAKLLYDLFNFDSGQDRFQYIFHKGIDIIIFVITIVIMAVPEGFSFAVTLSLAFFVGKMKEGKNLVRELDGN